MKKDDTIRIANLARIELAESEAESFTLEISGILTYVDQVKEITGDAPPDKVVGAVYNVMREDGEPHEGGLFTEDLLNLAPKRKGEYVEVKKILEEK
jgi:aspartyl-tRNA(Asn)/glutamyl-tRNA(Gln) amidotransferase subunit C